MPDVKFLEPLGVELDTLPATPEEWRDIPDLIQQAQGVLIVRNQNLDSSELETVLKSFAGTLGRRLLPYDRWPGQSPGVGKYLALLGNYQAREKDDIVAGATKGTTIAEYKPATMEISEFHTDGSFLANPKSHIALYAPMSKENALPTHGGETRFCSTKVTDETLRTKYARWTTVHSWESFMRFLEARDPKRPKVTAEQIRAKPDQLWEMMSPDSGNLYINPKNTKAVFDEQCRSVDPKVVWELAEYLLETNGVYWHQWRPGDLVLWDNRTLLHAATPFDAQTFQRLLFRAEFASYHIPSVPETVKWGYLENSEAIATVPSGSTIIVDTVSGSFLPTEYCFERIPPELEQIQQRITDRSYGPHILTGPIAVESALPGDVLKIEIENVRLRSDWAYTIHKKSGQIRNTKLHTNGTAETPWKSKVSCDPFFGVLGVATGKRVSSIPPSVSYGGNLDLRLLTAGSTLYIPIHCAEAKLFVGDGHARQGDGECCGTALETSLTGTFRLTVLKQQDSPTPLPEQVRAETNDALISIGVQDSIDKAVREAIDQMVHWLVELKRPADQIDAECLCSIAGNIHVTQCVNGDTRGAHMVLEKKHLPPVVE